MDAHPDRVAVRTPDDSVSYTFAELRERAERLAAGLHGLGLRRGDTLGIMLVNRPEFHVVDLAGLCVGATPFSVYNTSAPEQIVYLFGDAGARIAVTERQFLERAARRPRRRHAARDDRAAGRRARRRRLPDGVISLEQAEAAADGTFDLEASLAAVEPGDTLTLIYTSGTTGPAEGRDADPREPARDDERDARGVPVAGRTAPASRSCPSAHIADRWGSHYAALITYGYTMTTCSDPKQVMQIVESGESDVLRCACRGSGRS